MFVTSANGEGAIEGTPKDYSIDPKDPFSTHFKFGRFNAAKAAPRNTSGLNLPTGSASPPSLKGAVATTAMEEGTAGRRLAGCDPPSASPSSSPTMPPRGIVTTLAGSGSSGSDDGTGTSASFYEPYGVAVTPDGVTALVADKKNNNIRSITL